MKLVKIPTADATPDQLAEFAVNTLGLDVKDKTPEQVRSMVLAAWDKPNISVEEKKPAKNAPRQINKDAAPVEEAMGSAPGETTMVRILIATTDEPGGKEPVFVGFNGRGMWVPRGRPVEIRYPYFKAIEDAVKIVYTEEPLNDGTNRTKLVPNYVPSYPFQVMGDHPDGKAKAA